MRAALLVKREHANANCSCLRNSEVDPCNLVADIFQPRRVLAMLGARAHTSVWVGVYAD